MTVTTLDLRTALVVVDLQKGITAAPQTAAVVARAAQLADAFRERDLPVVLVNVVGRAPGRVERARPSAPQPADWSDIVPELGDGIRVTKRTWGAFHGTDLDAQLRAADVTQVVVVGIATSMGVESTARAAHEHGYNVTVVTDAVLDFDSASHENSLTRVFPALGETGTTEDVLRLLAANAR